MEGQQGDAGRARPELHGAARTATGALFGLAVLVVSAGVAAQDVALVAYQDTNLAQYGVPNFEALTPIGTKRFDRAESVPGDETVMHAYRAGQSLIATYSVRGRIYSVSFDTDGVRPVDYAFQDNDGSGNFVPVSPTSPSIPPDWVLE